MQEWAAACRQAAGAKKQVRIGIVGKYFGTGSFTLADSYISVIEAVKHAAWFLRRAPRIEWLDAEEYERNPKELWSLKEFDGIIVPGGFGSRGVEGKIKVAEFCRKNRIPYFGLCYGLHMAVIEFARNVAKMEDAHTTEVNPKTKYPVIDILPEQKENIETKQMGGSMRLGLYACRLKKGTIAARAYKKHSVKERHRHRYEVTNAFHERLTKQGMIFSGINPERNLVEIIELPGHPFYIGTQFHPELQSRFLHPHPLYIAFLQASISRNSLHL
jgi:CTP synthase